MAKNRGRIGQQKKTERKYGGGKNTIQSFHKLKIQEKDLKKSLTGDSPDKSRPRPKGKGVPWEEYSCWTSNLSQKKFSQ